MKLLSAIANFIGTMLSAMWATIAKEAKEPGEIRQLGGDSATVDAVKNNISNSIAKEEQDS